MLTFNAYDKICLGLLAVGGAIWIAADVANLLNSSGTSNALLGGLPNQVSVALTSKVIQLPDTAHFLSARDLTFFAAIAAVIAIAHMTAAPWLWYSVAGTLLVYCLAHVYGVI